MEEDFGLENPPARRQFPSARAIMISQIPRIILPRVFVAFVFALCSGAMSSAQTSGVFQNFQYTATTTEVTITRYPTYRGGSVIVPSTINGLPVTKIGERAFENCMGVTSIMLPASVETLDWLAFFGCRSLTTFSISSGVKSIGGNVFAGCSELASINVSSGNPAYSSLDGILYDEWRTTVIDIPEGKSGAVVLPNTVRSVSAANCGKITSIHIPASVTSIISTFHGCRMLASITVDPANSNYSSRDGMLFSKDFSKLLRVPGGKTGRVVVEEGTAITGFPAQTSAFYTANSVEEVVLPGSTTSIPSDFFWGCESLRVFVIPNGCTGIGDRAFAGCSSLEEINVPDAVESIGYAAFSGCSSLVRVRLPQGITAIGGQCFNGCGFTEFIIPEALVRIGDSALSQCRNLTSIVFPKSVEHIEARAFFITGLKSVTIPATVQTIGIIAFSACPDLQEIQVHPANANYASYDGVLYSKDMKTLMQCPAGKSGIITVPESVTAISQNAFSNCAKITAIRFMGNSPTWGSSGGTTPEILYFSGKTGFGSATWNGFMATNLGQPTLTGLWLFSHGLPYDRDLQNTDLGIPLLLAYALDIDPDASAAASVPDTAVGVNTISLTYFAGRSDIQYIPQFSTNLEDWQTTGIVISAADANGFRTATHPRSGGAQFMRLKVTQPLGR